MMTRTERPPAAPTTGAPPIAAASGAPLYVQVREAIRREIDEQGLRPGDRLPTEPELGARFGVSRATVRQAVGELEAAGVVHRQQGRGTFVGTGRIQHHPTLTSYSDLLRSQGFEPSHELLGTGLDPAPADVAEVLEVAVGAPCRRLERRFHADREPVGLSTTWLPAELLGPHDTAVVTGTRAGGSLYALLERADPALIPHRAMERIDATVASPAVAEQLGCAPGAPLLEIHRASFTSDDRPLEWTRLLFVPGRYSYRTELRRPAGPGDTHG